MNRLAILLVSVFFSTLVHSQDNGSAEISKFVNFYKTACKGNFMSISSQEQGDNKISWASISGQEGAGLYTALGNQESYAATVCYTTVNAPAKFTLMIEYRKMNEGAPGYTVQQIKKSYSGTMTSDGVFNLANGSTTLELKIVPREYMSTYTMLVDFGSSEQGVKTMTIEEDARKKWKNILGGVLERGLRRFEAIAPKLVEMSEKDDEDIRLGDIFGAIGEVDILGGVKKVGYEYSFVVLNVGSGDNELLPISDTDLAAVGLDGKAVGLGSDSEVTNEQLLMVFVGIFRDKNNNFEADLFALGKGLAVDAEDDKIKESWVVFNNTFYCSAVNFIDDSDEDFKQVVLKRLMDAEKGTKRQLWSRKLSKGKFNVFNVGQKKVRTYDVLANTTTVKEQDITVTNSVAGEKADLTATFRAAMSDIPSSFPSTGAVNTITGINGLVKDIATKLWPKKCDCQ